MFRLFDKLRGKKRIQLELTLIEPAFATELIKTRSPLFDEFISSLLQCLPSNVMLNLVFAAVDAYETEWTQPFHVVIAIDFGLNKEKQKELFSKNHFKSSYPIVLDRQDPEDPTSAFVCHPYDGKFQCYPITKAEDNPPESFPIVTTEVVISGVAVLLVIVVVFFFIWHRNKH